MNAIMDVETAIRVWFEKLAWKLLERLKSIWQFVKIWSTDISAAQACRIYILICWVLTWLSLQVIDERCGKPKSLDGASEGLTLVYYHTKKTVILFEDLQTWPFVKRNTNSWISNWQVNFLLLNYLKDIYWPPGRNFRFLPNQLKWFWQKVSLQFQVSSHLIHTGLTPSPTFPPRGAEADMPGVLQYHVESWVWEIWRGVWADEKGVWGCVYAQIWSYDTPLLIHPPPHPR